MKPYCPLGMNNCDSEIWLASLELLGLECPVVKRGFILVRVVGLSTTMLDEFKCSQIRLKLIASCSTMFNLPAQFLILDKSYQTNSL